MHLCGRHTQIVMGLPLKFIYKFFFYILFKNKKCVVIKLQGILIFFALKVFVYDLQTQNMNVFVKMCMERFDHGVLFTSSFCHQYTPTRSKQILSCGKMWNQAGAQFFVFVALGHQCQMTRTRGQFVGGPLQCSWKYFKNSIQNKGSDLPYGPPWHGFFGFGDKISKMATWHRNDFS